VVLLGLSGEEEKAFLERLGTRCFGKITPYEEEWARVQVAKEAEEPIPVGGPILVREMSLERLLVVADALAKSVVLDATSGRPPTCSTPSSRSRANWRRPARPRATEPICSSAGQLAAGPASCLRPRRGRREPDVLWDRPDLERLYARLEDEYELSERFETLNRKLAVISDTATTLADIIDAKRSLRLEIIVVFLIAFEIVIAAYELFARSGH